MKVSLDAAAIMATPENRRHVDCKYLVASIGSRWVRPSLPILQERRDSEVCRRTSKGIIFGSYGLRATHPPTPFIENWDATKLKLYIVSGPKLKQDLADKDPWQGDRGLT